MQRVIMLFKSDGEFYVFVTKMPVKRKKSI
jgi:hypothetical protein